MPDATRPTRSKFFKVLKSFVSLDGSLKRITENPGGKNLSIIFAYATSLAYDRSMYSPNDSGKFGIDVLRQHEWLTPRSWLDEMGWGGVEKTNLPIIRYSLFERYLIHLVRMEFLKSGVNTRGLSLNS